MPIVPNSVVPFEDFFTDLRYPGWRITGGHTDNDAGEHHIYLEPKGDALCPCALQDGPDAARPSKLQNLKGAPGKKRDFLAFL